MWAKAASAKPGAITCLNVHNIQWEHQKTKSFYDNIPPAERVKTDSFLKQTEGYALMLEPIAHPILRRNYRFGLA